MAVARRQVGGNNKLVIELNVNRTQSTSLYNFTNITIPSSHPAEKSSFSKRFYVAAWGLQHASNQNKSTLPHESTYIAIFSQHTFSHLYSDTALCVKNSVRHRHLADINFFIAKWARWMLIKCICSIWETKLLLKSHQLNSRTEWQQQNMRGVPLPLRAALFI